jgi:hypothetical protein
MLFESSSRSPSSSFTKLLLGWQPFLNILIYKPLVSLPYVASSFILSFRYSSCMFLTYLVASCLAFCNHCSLACFFDPIFWISFVQPRLMPLQFVITYTLLADILMFSLKNSQALLISTLSSKFSRAENLTVLFLLPHSVSWDWILIRLKHCHVFGVPWLIIKDSGLVDWIY